MLVWWILTLILRLIEKLWLHKRLIPSEYRRRIRLGVLLIIALVSGLMIYTAFYPSKSFFLDEWKSHTNFNLPSDSKIISRFADYPDFHGDYCAAVIFKLKQKDYNSIKQQLLSNKEFNDSTNFYSDILDKVLKGSGFKESDFNKRIGKDDAIIYFRDSDNLILLHSLTN